MDEEENTDVEKLSSDIEKDGETMRFDNPKCSPPHIRGSPSLQTGVGKSCLSKNETKMGNDEITVNCSSEEAPYDDCLDDAGCMDESVTEDDTECDEKLIINESYDHKDDDKEMEVQDEDNEGKHEDKAIGKKEFIINEDVEVDDKEKVDVKLKEMKINYEMERDNKVIEKEEQITNINRELITDVIKEEELKIEDEKPVKITIKRDNKMDEDDDKEEGELEEGELEDDEEEEVATTEKKEEEKLKEIPKVEKEAKEEVKKEKIKDNDKVENKEKRDKDDRKRKHKETDDERRKKKKKKHYSSEDEEKKKFSTREKSYDFDTLLKQEMYLVGSTNPAEAAYSSEGGGSNSFPANYSPFKGPVDVESFESCSGEEWDGKPRRRTKRKRRSSRSPSRKNEAICMFYLQGSCKRGNDCPYSHETAPTRKMELCKFYMMDCCAKKEKCLYMHKDFPCKYYHFGMKCKAGELCKFSHDSLQEITKNILLKHIELAPKDILGDFPRVSKHSAQMIISITEAKRKGENYEVSNLEPLYVLEGKGFKYLDRILKNVRKKKDGDKKGGEKDEKEKSPKKSRSRDDYPEGDKDKEREKDKDKERDKDRDKERDKDRNRDRNREKRRHKSKDHSSHKYRESSHKHRDASRTEHHQHANESRDKDGYGRSYDGSCPSPGMMTGHNTDSTKWYSSDEEGDSNNPSGFRRNAGSPQDRRQKMDNNAQEPIKPQGPFNVQSALPHIDVMYLKNVLSAVHNQSSQIQNSKSVNPANDDPRGNNSNWDTRSNRYSPRDNRSVSNYMDVISNDIKEVFYDGPDQKDSLPPKDDFSSGIDSLLQRARGRSSSYQDYREDFRERGQPNYRDDFRDPEEINSSRDFKYQGPEPSWNQGNNSRSHGRDGSFNFRQDYSGDRDRSYPVDGGYPRDANPWENKRDFDSRVNGKPSGSKNNLDFRERETKGDFSPVNNRQNSITNDEDDDRPVSSIYDFDYRPTNNANPDYDLDDNMPFRVPTHIVAEEINACMTVRHPAFRLVEVDVPKPDYSKIKLKPDDPKTMDDPRLKKVIRRSSLDSPRSPQGKYDDTLIRSPPPIFENKESRDPRKLSSRDPRTESKVLPRADVRTDPRVASRADPSFTNARSDPRMDNRNHRMDPRDVMLDTDMMDVEPRMGGPLYVNGMMDGPNYPQFQNMGMPNPIMPQGIDPRGRPGILGPAPGQGPKVPMGLPGPMNQGMGNPFLLPQGMGGPPNPFMSGDRGDLMGGNGPFNQGQWGGGGRMNCNDPRLNRDLDMGS